jgi:5-methylcytosine-specific restriction endonuclease McrA
MPIKPENRHRYPKNWPQIRASILERAGHKCEQCGAPDRTTIWRGMNEDAGLWALVVEDHLRLYCETTGEERGWAWGYDREGRPVKVILTIAHLDQQPENNDPSNLKALCQRCHLAHDRVDNQTKAKATRRSHTADMFGGVA